MRHSGGPRDVASAATRLTLINLNVNRICLRPTVTIEPSILPAVRAECSYKAGGGTHIGQMTQYGLLLPANKFRVVDIAVTNSLSLRLLVKRGD